MLHKILIWLGLIDDDRPRPLSPYYQAQLDRLDAASQVQRGRLQVLMAAAHWREP